MKSTRTLRVLGITTILVAAPPKASGITYAAWLEQNFTPAQMQEEAVSGAQADPDGDGFPNLLEFATGGNPFASEKDLFQTIMSSLAGVTYRIPLRPDRAVIVDAEFSNDLQSWSGGINFSRARMVNGLFEISDRTPPTGQQYRFRRLVITLPYEPDDLDGDGLADGYEREVFGNLAAGSLDDTDGDGLLNIQEYLGYTLLSGDPEFSDLRISMDAGQRDSDGDGTEDGEEIDRGFNPTNFGQTAGPGELQRTVPLEFKLTYLFSDHLPEDPVTRVPDGKLEIENSHSGETYKNFRLTFPWSVRTLFDKPHFGQKIAQTKTIRIYAPDSKSIRVGLAVYSPQPQRGFVTWGMLGFTPGTSMDLDTIVPQFFKISPSDSIFPILPQNSYGAIFTPFSSPMEMEFWTLPAKAEMTLLSSFGPVNTPGLNSIYVNSDSDENNSALDGSLQPDLFDQDIALAGQIIKDDELVPLLLQTREVREQTIQLGGGPQIIGDIFAGFSNTFAEPSIISLNVVNETAQSGRVRIWNVDGNPATASIWPGIATGIPPHLLNLDSNVGRVVWLEGLSRGTVELELSVQTASQTLTSRKTIEVLSSFGLKCDLDNNGQIDNEDARLGSAANRAAATEDQIEDGTEYLFVNDLLSNGAWDLQDPGSAGHPLATSDDDSQELDSIVEAKNGAVWFDHPAIQTLSFYKTKFCAPSDKIVFPYILSTQNSFPPKLYVRADGPDDALKLAREVKGYLRMLVGNCDQTEVFQESKIRLTIVKDFGAKSYFNSARDYIFEHNTKFYTQDKQYEDNGRYRLAVMREDATSLRCLDAYDHVNDKPLFKGIDRVRDAFPAFDVIINGNFCWFAEGFFYPGISMTDRCDGRLCINRMVMRPPSEDNHNPIAGEEYGRWVGYYSGTQRWEFATGRLPENSDLTPDQGIGGLSTNYPEPSRKDEECQFIGFGLSKIKQHRMIFVASSFPGTAGQATAVALDAAQSGVPRLFTDDSHALSDGSQPLKLFNLDGSSSVALCLKSPSDSLQTVFAGTKHNAWPYYINTYVGFVCKRPRD